MSVVNGFKNENKMYVFYSFASLNTLRNLRKLYSLTIPHLNTYTVNSYTLMPKQTFLA